MINIIHRNDTFPGNFLFSSKEQIMSNPRGVRRIDENTVLVNLNAVPDPILKEGWPMRANQLAHSFEVQKRADGLYFDNQKLMPCFSHQCIDRSPLDGYELYLDKDGYLSRKKAQADQHPWRGERTLMVGGSTIYSIDPTGIAKLTNINIAYMFLEHPDMFPREWEGHQGHDRTIWFFVSKSWMSPYWNAIRGISRKNGEWEVKHNYRDSHEEVMSIEHYPPKNERELYCPANAPDLLRA